MHATLRTSALLALALLTGVAHADPPRGGQTIDSYQRPVLRSDSLFTWPVSAQQLGDRLFSGLPAGVTIDSVSYTGHPDSAALTDAINWSGALNGGGLQLPPGVLLTNGIVPPESNTRHNFSINAEQPGDADLDAVLGDATIDATALEIVFTVDGTIGSVSLEFFFGSDEFPEYIPQGFGDGAAILLDGVNIGTDGLGMPVSVASEALNLNNTGEPVAGTIDVDFPIEYDGLTGVLSAFAPLEAGQHTLKIVIGDTGDFFVDSGLFVSRVNFELACDGSGTPPVLDPLPESVVVSAGALFELPVGATHPEPGREVMLFTNPAALPAGMVFDSTAGNPASGTLAFAPDASQIGASFDVFFVAISNEPSGGIACDLAGVTFNVGADIAVGLEGLSVDPSEPVQGETVTISVDTFNDSLVPVTADLAFYRDAIPPDENAIQIGRLSEITFPAESFGTQQLNWNTSSVDSFVDVFAVLEEINPPGDDPSDNVASGSLSVQPAPNLFVDSITAPQDAIAGDVVTIEWTILNTTAVEATAPWIDRVYLSFDDELGPGDIIAANVERTENLAGEAIYTVQTDVTLPPTGTQVYVIIHTDATNALFEANNEGDNIRVSDQPISLRTSPDFIVSIEAFPSDAQDAGLVELQWTITNVGLPATGTWRDAIVLRTIPPTEDNLLALFEFNGPLGTNESYTRTEQALLPSGVFGAVFLGVQADVDNDVFENLGEDNNLVFAQLTTTIALPDLNPSFFSAPSEIVAGVESSANWDVSNIGAGRVFEPSWTDRVYLSTDETVDPDDVVLFSAPVDGFVLDPDTEYSDERDFTIPLGPDSPLGSYFLLLEADADGEQVELDELNNVVARPVEIVLPPLPDLSVSIEPLPGDGVAGRLYTFEYTVTNTGSVVATAPWQDRVFLSTDASPGGDVLEQVVSVSTDLGPGESYTQEVSFNLPVQVGERWIVVRTDALDVINEGPLEANNVAVSDAPFVIRTPDLIVEAIEVPSVAFDGEPATLEWTIRNNGDGAATGVWTDVVYLSEDDVFDPNDTVLAPFTSPSELAAGEAYVRTVEITVPAGISGDWYFVVVTDTGGQVPEVGGEDNNSLVSVAVPIEQLLLPDFQIAELIPSDAQYVGESFTIAWCAENNGAGTANGTWRDRVYLSEDLTFDPAADLLLGQRPRTDVLEPGAQYFQSFSFNLPDEAGDYFLFVVVDQADEIREEDEDNNVDVVPLSVLAPEYSAVVQADVEAAPAGTPITFSGSATLLDGGAPAGEVPVDIRLKLRQTTRVFRVTTAPDGTFSRVFNPLANEAGVYTVSADHPAVEDVDPEDSFVLHGLRVTPATGQAILTVGETTTRMLTLTNFGDLPLTGLTASTLDLPPNVSPQLNLPGEIAPQASVNVQLRLDATSNDPSSATPTFTVLTSEGASDTYQLALTIRDPQPFLIATPTPVVADMVRGEIDYVELEITNVGGGSTGPLDVSLPAAPWLSLASPSTIDPLGPGMSATVVLRLAPAADLPLGPYSGGLLVEGAAASVSVPFTFTAVSTGLGDLRVEVTDEFSYWDAPDFPRVSGALVRVIDANTDVLVGEQTTGDDGIVLFADLVEAYYRIEVSEPDHGNFATTFLVVGGQLNELEAFLPAQVVDYQWEVIPIDLEDNYEIVIDAVFETNVPAPVITIEPPLVELTALNQQTTQIDFTITNHGLIQADAAQFVYNGNDRYVITPLVDVLGDLPAQSSVTVPVVIEDLDFGREVGERLDCGSVQLKVQYTLICGIPLTYFVPVNFIQGADDCGGSGPIIVPPASGGGGGIIPISQPQPTEDIPCDPCLAPCALALLDCGLGFTPAGCPWGLARSCSGGFGPVDPIACGLSVAGCIPAVSVGAGVLSCIYGIGTGCACLAGGGGGGGGPGNPAPREAIVFYEQIPREGIEDPIYDYFIEAGNRQIAFMDYMAYLFGNTAWFEGSEEDADASQAIFDALGTALTPESDAGEVISATEQADILAMPRPIHLDELIINAAIERFNRTVDYYGQGIFTLDDVPAGWSTDFIDAQIREDKLQFFLVKLDDDEDEGFTRFLESSDYAYEVLRDDIFDDQEGFCAQVRIQIVQEAVVTRSGFQAALTLTNNGTELPLDNVLVDIVVKDGTGVDATDLFGILPPTVSGDLPAFDGTASLDPLSEASAEWIIVPSDEAAPEEPTVYYVSGMISYALNDEIVAIPLYPVSITVYPNPSLSLKYFLEKVVYSDDPFTEDVVEPAVPFSLGLLVTNNGAGAAQNLRITSAQPEIIENDQGLLINFTIIGSQVQGEDASTSLTVDFGEILPSVTKVARWLMTATLQGEFVAYSATFEQVGPLGELGLAVIDEIEIFEMNHVVRVDDPFDDELPDFLVNEFPDLEDLPDEVHTSGGDVLDVTPTLDGTIDGPIMAGDLTAVLSVDLASGWNYIRVDDPASDAFELVSVLRSDGREIRLGDNAWRTSRVDRPAGEPPNPLRYVHVFDRVDDPGAVSYTLTFAPVLQGDINGDNEVNMEDLNIMFDNWGEAGDDVPGDLNGDGVVDAADLNLLLTNWSGGRVRNQQAPSESAAGNAVAPGRRAQPRGVAESRP